MSFDPNRLFAQLLNTGLQTKDNPLYQVIHQLITSQAELTALVAKLAEEVNITQTIQNITVNQVNQTTPIIIDDSPSDDGFIFHT